MGICACTYMYKDVQRCIYACGVQRGMLGAFSHPKFLSKPRAHYYGKSSLCHHYGKPTTVSLLVPATFTTRVKGACRHTLLFMSTGYSNSSSHACKVSVLPHRVIFLTPKTALQCKTITISIT